MRSVSMKYLLHLCFVLFIIVSFSSCSKTKTDREKLVDEISGVIERLEVDPVKPHSNSFVRVLPKYKTNKYNHLLHLKYEWRLNGKPLPEVNSRLLDKKYFKKKDTVQCTAFIMQGKKVLNEIKTKKIVIANSPPKILAKPLPRIKVPGMMLYQIEASDPDGDDLAYKLVSPLDLGIDLDVKNGLITWTINDDTLSLIEARRKTEEGSTGENSTEKETRSVTSLAIHFQVSDGDGGLALGKITFEYTRIKGKPVLKIRDDVRQ
jgi:hypothetical protein